MHPSYSDIQSRILEKPTWYDIHGCPRYGKFEPRALGVYDEFAALFKIRCQNCHEEFLVAYGTPRYNIQALAIAGQMGVNVKEIPSEKFTNTLEEITEIFHYGDPPIHGCVGDTMSSESLACVEAWRKGSWAENRMEWKRVPELEITYPEPDYSDPYPVLDP